MRRASRAGQRYQTRLIFCDRHGELWEWVTSLPEGHRVQEVWFHLQLGIKTARAMAQSSGFDGAGGDGASTRRDGPPLPRPGRGGKRCAVRLNFCDRHGELWEWVTSFPERHRVQEIWFHLQLGIKTARLMAQNGGARGAGGQVANATATSAAVPRPTGKGDAPALDDEWDPVALLGDTQ